MTNLTPKNRFCTALQPDQPATRSPALSVCIALMTSGEKRLVYLCLSGADVVGRLHQAAHPCDITNGFGEKVASSWASSIQA